MELGVGHVYELTYNPRPFAAGLLGVAAVVSGVSELSSEVNGGISGTAVFFIVGGVLLALRGVQIALYWPTRIVVGDAGLGFVARARERTVAWSEIREVRISRRRFGGSIRWRLAHRPHVASAATFSHLHRLLVDIERHAPHVRVVD